MKDLKFSLEENAIDSLIHGIEHFIDSLETKFNILKSQLIKKQLK
ncbi:MAG: hypothetical protein STSR0008_24950 [Ignavibacterium sp.]